MLNIQTIIDVVSQQCRNTDVTADTSFIELEMDSTQLVELLIEFEILLDIDVLDANLNLDRLQTVGEVYQYLSFVLSRKELKQ